MRTLIIATLTATGWTFYATRNFDVSGFAGLVIGVLSFIISEIVKRGKREAYLRECIEPQFIIPINPDTGERLRLPDKLANLAHHVPTRKIRRVEKELRIAFEKSKNPFFADDLEPTNQLPIVGFRYQSGERVNETWEEFTQYVIDRIRDTRAKWHKDMKEANEDWYEDRHHHIEV